MYRLFALPLTMGPLNTKHTDGSIGIEPKTPDCLWNERKNEQSSSRQSHMAPLVEGQSTEEDGKRRCTAE